MASRGDALVRCFSEFEREDPLVLYYIMVLEVSIWFGACFSFHRKLVLKATDAEPEETSFKYVIYTHLTPEGQALEPRRRAARGEDLFGVGGKHAQRG